MENRSILKFDEIFEAISTTFILHLCRYFTVFYSPHSTENIADNLFANFNLLLRGLSLQFPQIWVFNGRFRRSPFHRLIVADFIVLAFTDLLFSLEEPCEDLQRSRDDDEDLQRRFAILIGRYSNGTEDVGIGNDTAESDRVVDIGVGYEVFSAEQGQKKGAGRQATQIICGV